MYYVFGIWKNVPDTQEIPTKKSDSTVTKRMDDSKETYKTVSPTILDEGQSLTLIGTIISNEFATVYSRRSGIIKDLYIDIGDSVNENQTIWELLPPWDVGQSSANIYEKQVKVEEAEANLEFIENVSKQMVGKVSLAKDLQEFDGDTASAEMLKKIKVDIESSKRELAQIELKHKEQLKKIQADLTQETSQSQVLVESILQTLEHIMLWSDHSTNTIYTDDLRVGLGVKNTSTRRESLDTYSKLKLSYERGDYSISSLLDSSYTTISVFLDMIEYSTTRENLTQDMLENFTQMLLSKQTSILNMKEMIEDIENLYATTIESQAQEFVMFENMINKWNAALWEKTATFQDALEKAEQQVDLVAAEQGLKVQQAKNNLLVSKAILWKEYASSWNEKIVTPFWGTVSKRMVQVGDMVSMWMPLYELIDVPTSLSKKAKREVQFGLPEEYLNLISMWDSIYFSSAQSDIHIYTWSIHRISPQIDQMSKTVIIQATLPDWVNLPHNSRVNITLAMIQKKSYQVPTSTIIYTAWEAFLPLLDENEDITLMSISVLADDGEFADVQWDLSTNDLIIQNYWAMR